MSWIVTMLLAGAVLTSGGGTQAYEQMVPAKRSQAPLPVVLDESERFAQTYAFDPNGRIEVSNINGSIVIEAWDSPQISLEAVKIADTKERLSDVEIIVEATQSEFSVRTEYKSRKEKTRTGTYGGEGKNYTKLQVDFKLKVPRTASLKEIETINGSVEVSEMTNYTEVSAVNGAVRARNLAGTAKLSTVNGTVDADFDQLGGESMIALSTVNGTVKLALPSGTNATVKADSVNGGISNDFGLPVRKGKYVGRDLYGRIGSGEVKIKLNSVNGGISIGRKDDGGVPNPVVDLLPQKTSDDFDDTFDSRFEVELGRINRDFERALMESQAKIEFSGKEVEKAVKALESAMVNVHPEIAVSAEAIKRATAALDREELGRELDAERARLEAELAKASEALYMGRSPFIEEKTGSFEVSGTPTVTVDAKNCAVRVTGWDKQEVKYSVTRLRRNDSGGEVRVETSKDGQDVTLHVKNTGTAAGSPSEFLNKVRLEVFVPKKSNLRIRTDGEVRLEGVTGNLELIGSKDAVNIRDSYGVLKIDGAKGTVRIIGFEGDLAARGIKGDLYLEGDFRNITAEEGSGTVFLTLPDDADATISACEMDLMDAVAVNENTYKLGPLNIVRQDDSTWKVGNGKAKYIFSQKEGGLQIRPRSLMYVN